MYKNYQFKRPGGDVRKGLAWEIIAPKANVIILTGMEEHSRRYDALATYLNEQGFNVYCLDAFGQGENVSGDLHDLGVWPIDGFYKQVDITHELTLKLKESCLPTYLFSHSMGSFMAQAFIQKYPLDVSKVILCGSGSKNPAVKLGYFLAKMIVHKKNRLKKAKFLNKLMFSNFNRKIKHPENNFAWLSYNKENVARYIGDPLCGYGPNNGFCLEFLKGLKTIHQKKNLRLISPSIDIFIVSGSEDPVSYYSRSVLRLEKMYRKHGVKKVSTKIYPHARHEILNEDCQKEVYHDIALFFQN